SDRARDVAREEAVRQRGFLLGADVSLPRHSDAPLHADLRLRACNGLVRARVRAAGGQQADPPERRIRRSRPARVRAARGPGRLVRPGSASHFVTTYQLFWMSCARRFVSTVRKPARARYSRAFSSPHIAPSPSPPCASDTVMQCMHETV